MGSCIHCRLTPSNYSLFFSNQSFMDSSKALFNLIRFFKAAILNSVSSSSSTIVVNMPHLRGRIPPVHASGLGSAASRLSGTRRSI
jgi:hypothetical protein